MAPPSYNVVVVGAGISGLAAAKFYLDVHPDCRLIILEKERCLGGVWSTKKSYPGFWTQWTVGMAEFSDKPMKTPPPEDTWFSFFRSTHTTQYLEEYADSGRWSWKTLRDRILFNTKVCNIQKLEGGWRIYCEDEKGREKILHTSKLMIASGVTSVPRMPDLRNLEKFEKPVIHQESFGDSGILSSKDIQRVTVLGGGMSAADMVYDSVKAGKSVSWLIRTTRTGPVDFTSPKGKGLYSNTFDLSSTRAISTLTPSVYNQNTWWTKFLHASNLGQKVVTRAWQSCNKELREEVILEDRAPGNEFDKLKPKNPIFWQNGSVGLINRPDFLQTITNNVETHYDNILHLEKGLIRTTGGREMATDALLCGTGWLSSLDIFDTKLLYSLGLPSPLETASTEDAEKWTELEKLADEEILTQFPHLRNPPDHYHKPVETTPYRLYKSIAPLRDDSIVFIGHVVVGNYFRVAECQAIWATAYLDKHLELPSLADRETAVARFRAWCRRRYLSDGEVSNWMAFDWLGYTDELLKEVGLSSHRKWWFSDRFMPSKPGDLKDLKDEYLRKFPEVRGK